MQDPMLTQEENTQLQNQIVDELMAVSQKLCLSYLFLFDTLRRRAVFSDQANKSRLAAKMALDCTSLLNVHSIRRNIAMGIKVQRKARLRAEKQSDHGCNSMPDLGRETLLEELEMDALPTRPQSPLVLLVTAPVASVLTQHKEKVMISPPEDLQRCDLDYLNVIFHMCNYSESDDEDNDEEKKMLPQERQEEREKRRMGKIETLRRTKQQFITGLWNKQVVQMKKDNEEPSDGELQNRLKRIWATLSLPETHRMDMAIKYSSNGHRNQLVEATAAWEKCCSSGPAEGGLACYKGVYWDRINESRERNELNSNISLLERKLSKILDQITERFHDTVTFKGRPYGQKMRWDRIEMLYWLQQDRRVHTLKKVVEGRHFPARLCPLDPNLRQYPATHPTPMKLTASVNDSIQPPEPLNPSDLSLSCVSLLSFISDNK
ncbi:uncharacterized protein FYW47_014242 [Aplochiton taeniatus]